MRAKKRAKSVKFGKKRESTQDKKDEKNPTIEHTPLNEENLANVANQQPSNANVPTNEAVHQSPQPINEQSTVPLSAPEVANNIGQESLTEKNTNPQNQEQDQPKISPPTSIELEQNPLLPDTEQIPAPQNQEITPQQPTTSQTYAVKTEVKKNILVYFLVVALISFIVGLLSMAGISMLFEKKPFELPFVFNKIAKTSPTPAPTITIIPTISKEPNLAEYNIQILNGSAITGAASKLKDALTTEGFKVVSIGNADKNDYTDTVIFAKKEVNSAYLNKLKDKLKKTYSLTDAKISPVESNETDIIITIGSKSASDSAK